MYVCMYVNAYCIYVCIYVYLDSKHFLLVYEYICMLPILQQAIGVCMFEFVYM